MKLWRWLLDRRCAQFGLIPLHYAVTWPRIKFVFGIEPLTRDDDDDGPSGRKVLA